MYGKTCEMYMVECVSDPEGIYLLSQLEIYINQKSVNRARKGVCCWIAMAQNVQEMP